MNYLPLIIASLIVTVAKVGAIYEMYVIFL